MRGKMWKAFGCSSAVFLWVFLATGCEGPRGGAGTPAVDKGGISGTVTDSATGTGLTGATVVTGSYQATTDSSGNFTIPNLSIGVYQLTASLSGYNSAQSGFIGVVAGQTASVNMAVSRITPANQAPTLSLASLYQAGFGTAVNLTAVGNDPDGNSALLTYSWTVSDAEGNSVATGTSATISFNTATLSAAYGPLSDRFGVIGLSPTDQASYSVKVTVKDPGNLSASTTGTVTAASRSAGIRNIPIGLAIYLNSGRASGNTWTCSTPSGDLCTTEFSGGNTQTPRFLPDVIGGFTFTESGTPPTVNTTTIYAGSWLGIGTSSAQTNCLLCHNDIIAPAAFDEWATTLHSVMAKMGLDGFRSSHYGSSCLECHTVGYDKAASNGGFDDVSGWTFPTVLKPGTFVSQPAAIQQLANIQCENCHGPQSNGAGGYTLAHAMTSSAIFPDLVETARVTHDPAVCAQCHDDPPHHATVQEWKGSGHANLALAREVGAGSSRSSCARCHASQGFVWWLDQQQAGNPGNIANFSNVYTALGLTDRLVQPQVCAACHDAMMNDDDPAALANGSPEAGAYMTTTPNHHQVRLMDNTGLLPAGYSASGMGLGALCMMCHNTRNGVLTSSNFGTCIRGGPYNLTTYLHEDGACGMTGPSSYPAPHVAAQADVLNGHNAYFTTSWLPNGTSFLSKHENVGDTCVGCHMVLNPNGLHAFTINDSDRPTLCANCHGYTSGDALVTQVKGLLDDLAADIESMYLTDISTAISAGRTVTVTATATDPITEVECTSATPITITAAPVDVSKMQLEEIHGQYGLAVTLPSAVSIAWNNPSGCPNLPTSTDTISFQVGTLMTEATSFDPNANKQSYNLVLLNNSVIRKNWNYWLFESDSSFGIHNPTFVVNTLKSTIDAP